VATYSADWSDADVTELVALCRRVQIHPLHLLACMFSESNARADARNPGDPSRAAVAVGLIQFTKAWLGRDGDLDAVRTKGVAGQLPLVERYFTPFAGRLTTPARVYTAMFLPATLDWPGFNDTMVLTSLHGPLAWAYLPNRSLDHDDKGFISVADLGHAADRAAQGKRWTELSARVLGALQDRQTDPELPEIREDNRDDATSETFPGNDDGEGPEAA
jgi:hypothetical protein